MKSTLISIIIPAYKQEKTIKKDLKSVDKILQKGLPKNMKYEIICVLDGILDNSLSEVKKLKNKKIKIYFYKKNHGKGHAVRFGMRRAKGNLISFLDAGMDISPNGIMMLLAHMQWYDADIIVGSKRHPVSHVNYPPLRHVLSIGYHWGVKLLFGLPLRDTQSGIKIFKKKVIKKLLPRLVVNRYAMDIEMLAVAKHLGFERIFEAPIEVEFDSKTSKIKWHTIFEMAKDTMTVYYRLKIVKSYD